MELWPFIERYFPKDISHPRFLNMTLLEKDGIFSFQGLRNSLSQSAVVLSPSHISKWKRSEQGGSVH